MPKHTETHDDNKNAPRLSPFRASRFSKGLLIWIGLAISFEFVSLRAVSIAKLLHGTADLLDHDLLFSTPSEGRELVQQLGPQKFYHELHDEIHDRASSKSEFGHQRKKSSSAFNQATVVTHAKWFNSRQECRHRAGCCVETVAISLDQDDHKIVNTGDGKDLADMKLEFNRRPFPYLKYHATPYMEELMPCLVPGTVLFLENEDKTLTYFWNRIRPKIFVPYALVLSGTDGNTPDYWMSQQFMWQKDPLLIKLYGTNPNITSDVAAFNKYQALPTGLSRAYPQEKHLEQYLELNNYQNPFANKDRWDLSKQPLHFDNDVFVHWGLRLNHRRQLWGAICNHTTTAEGELSCHSETGKHAVNDIYASMSKYRFGISPTGKGWDCYRTYELLLLGIIPIIEERLDLGSRELLEGLPVIQMHMFDDVRKNKKGPRSKEYFIEVIQEYIASDEFQKTNFDEGWQKLFMRYHRRQLLKDTGRDKEIVKDGDGKEYYLGYKYSMAINHGRMKETFCVDKDKCKSPAMKAVNDDWFEKLPKPNGKDVDFITGVNRTWKKK